MDCNGDTVIPKFKQADHWDCCHDTFIWHMISKWVNGGMYGVQYGQYGDDSNGFKTVQQAAMTASLSTMTKDEKRVFLQFLSNSLVLTINIWILLTFYLNIDNLKQ